MLKLKNPLHFIPIPIISLTALIYTTIPANFSIFLVCHRSKFPTYKGHGGLTDILFSTVSYGTEILDFPLPHNAVPLRLLTTDGFSILAVVSPRET